MTEQECTEHGERVRNTETDQQRSEFRNQVHEQMMRRGEERGTALSDEPGQRRKGRFDPDSGYGSGRGGGGRGR